MKLELAVLIMLPALALQAAEIRSDFASGRAYYQQGDFKKALIHFQRALKTDPNNAEVYYWTGMSYQGLGDVATPFGARYHSKARAYLRKAVDLAPGRTHYRRELFDCFLDSAQSSPSALKTAAGMLREARDHYPEDEYQEMVSRLEKERKISSSVEARFDRLFQVIPDVAGQIW